MQDDAIIRNTHGLEKACAQAKEDGLLSLDTEFVWTSTYRPRLGLVQLGCRSSCWGLDCMTGLHADALAEIVADASVVKILHDARQDLWLVNHYAHCLPRSVFDTQLAATFAGFPAGVGLQKLLFDAIGVGLPKTETCTDWTRRPLSPAQVDYALDDVRYLPALRDALVARARELGTLAWLEADLAALDDPSIYADADERSAWRRIKTGRAHLDRRGFAMLRELASARELMACEQNRPRGWFGDDESLVRMAIDRRVGRFRHRLNGAQAQFAAANYAKAIEAGMAVPDEDCPENPRPRYIQEVVDAAESAVAWLRATADAHHVDPGVVASRAEVTAFVDNADDESNPLSSGWRWEAFGREIAARFAVA